jgi:hypothetical protein
MGKGREEGKGKARGRRERQDEGPPVTDCAARWRRAGDGPVLLPVSGHFSTLNVEPIEVASSVMDEYMNVLHIATRCCCTAFATPSVFSPSLNLLN